MRRGGGDANATAHGGLTAVIISPPLQPRTNPTDYRRDMALREFDAPMADFDASPTALRVIHK
jgi:hypothetical protein